MDLDAVISKRLSYDNAVSSVAEGAGVETWVLITVLDKKGTPCRL